MNEISPAMVNKAAKQIGEFTGLADVVTRTEDQMDISKLFENSDIWVPFLNDSIGKKPRTMDELRTIVRKVCHKVLDEIDNFEMRRNLTTAKEDAHDLHGSGPRSV